MEIIGQLSSHDISFMGSEACQPQIVNIYNLLGVFKKNKANFKVYKIE